MKPKTRTTLTLAPTTSPEEEISQDAIISGLSMVVPAIAGMFGRNCEVVAHDLRRPEASIVAIANEHVTGRKLGGPLVGGPFGDIALKWLNQFDDENQWRIYETRTRDGRKLKSATVLYRTSNGKPFAALCINYDLASVLNTSSWINELLQIDVPQEQRSKEEDQPDVDDILSNLIQESLSQVPSPTKLTKEERFNIVRELDERGAFLIRGAVRRVAKAVGVSKYTIYSDLDKLRNDER